MRTSMIFAATLVLVFMACGDAFARGGGRGGGGAGRGQSMRGMTQAAPYGYYGQAGSLQQQQMRMMQYRYGRSQRAYAPQQAMMSQQRQQQFRRGMGNGQGAAGGQAGAMQRQRLRDGACPANPGATVPATQ